jgi:hypothetical protein
MKSEKNSIPAASQLQFRHHFELERCLKKLNPFMITAKTFSLTVEESRLLDKTYLKLYPQRGAA